MAIFALLLVFCAKSFLVIDNANHLTIRKSKKGLIEAVRKTESGETISQHETKWLMAIFVFGTDGDDEIDLRAITEIPTWIFAKAGDDLIYGSQSNDWIFAGDGADTIDGQLAHDRIYPGNGRDQIYDMNEEDKIHSRLAEDFVMRPALAKAKEEKKDAI